LGKASSKKKDHKSKSDAKSPAPTPVANNNGRKCYICNDPNHLANACPQKGKHKQNAKSKLHANKSFLTLFKSSFPTLDQQACASRMIDAWDEDHICSSCIQPSFFAHECNPNNSSVIAHVPHVRQTIASTSLLHYIQEAHKPHNNSLQASNPVSMNTSFFLQAESIVRTAQEINLLYTGIRQVMMNLTDRQTVTHTHYAKIIRNPAITIAIVIRITTVMMIITVMRITIVNMTTTLRYTARIQVTNDNQRH
jgi:hypothetical protein